MIELYYTLKMALAVVIYGGLAIIALILLIIALINIWRDNRNGKRK